MNVSVAKYGQLLPQHLYRDNVYMLQKMSITVTRHNIRITMKLIYISKCLTKVYFIVNCGLCITFFKSVLHFNTYIYFKCKRLAFIEWAYGHLNRKYCYLIANKANCIYYNNCYFGIVHLICQLHYVKCDKRKCYKYILTPQIFII